MAPTRLKYRDGIPILPPKSPDLKSTETPINYRDCTPGKCLQCTLASVRCEFSTRYKIVSGICGRCKCTGGTCLVRRPSRLEDSGNEVLGNDPTDWIAVEACVPEEEAVMLAQELKSKNQEAGRRDICGVSVMEGDCRGWAFPRLKMEGIEEKEKEEDGEFWKTWLLRKSTKD
ncbi:uncharacterized protein CTRU02_213786 [Colletotrichum truncatum]|uniref:Uncharacterized protein n=1 Tax=Colletotrichum truncatum TaxID=5467 RepID=A0ACC3YGU8_COLTU|nr:uncharacterized protein CTRU02_14710 [Colletotrichum truncatum]KAF6781926.1 hypothetical protein CTRU02_14710 [Colletotrichum truncatum]